MRINEDISVITENPQIDFRQYFERLERISKTGSFIWDLNNDFLDCSENLFILVGMKIPEDLRMDKNSFFELIDQNTKNFVLDVMQDCMIKNHEFDVVFNLAKGRKTIKMFGYPEGGINDKFILGVLYDISNQVDSNQALLSGQDSERKRISLELHDSVCQQLVALKFQLALVKINNDINLVDEVNENLDSAINEIRTITHNLSVQIVSERGLKKSLSKLLSQTADNLNASINFSFDLNDKNGKEIALDEEDAKMIYRIVQECLSNTLKHSKATKIALSVKLINNQIKVSISDNGVGFNTAKSFSGIGLHNIRERVSYLNGYFKVDSEPNKGVKTTIKIPYVI